jgi:hypothetical protein
LGNLYFNAGKIDLADAEYLRALQTMPGYAMRWRVSDGCELPGQGRRGDHLAHPGQPAMPVPEFVIALGSYTQPPASH